MYFPFQKDCQSPLKTLAHTVMHWMQNWSAANRLELHPGKLLTWGLPKTRPWSYVLAIHSSLLIARAAIVEFESPRLTLPESAAEHSITVIRTGDLGESSSVGVTAKDATSAGARDYLLSTRLIEFAPGEATQTIHFLALQDHLTEQDEELMLELAPLTAGTSLGEYDTLRIVISDSDRPGSVDHDFHLDSTIGHAGSQSSPVAGAEWITVQPDGKLLVSGAFYDRTHARGISLMRLHPDGSLDTSFAPAPMTEAFDLLVQHSFTRLLPNGDILVSTGIPKAEQQLIRIHADGTRDAHFQVQLLPDSPPAPLIRTAVVQADGRILIGGAFTQVNGIPRAGLARLEPDGRLDLSFLKGEGASLRSPGREPFAGTVSALAIQKDGTIWVGGQFNLFGNQQRNHLARLDREGNLHPGNSPGIAFALIGAALPFVSSILCDDQDPIVVGGQFDQVGGVAKTNMVRLTPNGNVDARFDVPSALGCEDGLPFGAVRSVVLEHSGRFLVNLEPARGKVCRTLFRILQDGALDTEFMDPPVSAEIPSFFRYPRVRCLAVDSSGAILIGGEFADLGFTAEAGIARLNGGVRGFRFNSVVRHIDGTTSLEYEIPRGHEYRLLASPDLIHWEDVPNANPLSDRTQFMVTQPTEKTRRFYRAEALSFPE